MTLYVLSNDSVISQLLNFYIDLFVYIYIYMFNSVILISVRHDALMKGIMIKNNLNMFQFYITCMILG